MSHVAEGDLHAYLDGAVLPDTPEYEGIQAHLAFCSDCRVRLDEAAELRAQAQEALGELRTAEVTVPPFHEVVRMASPEPVSGSPARRPVLIAVAAAAMLVLAFGLGWMGRDVANLLGPRSGLVTSEADDDRSPDTFAELGAADPGGSGRPQEAADVAGEEAGPAQPASSGEPQEPGSAPASPSTSGDGTGGDDASEPASAPGLPRVALARPSVARVPSPKAPLRSLEPLAREAPAGGEVGARVLGEEVAVPGSYGREAAGERLVTPDPALPRPSPVFPWPSVGDRPDAARAPLSLREDVAVPSRGEAREPATLSRERAELRLGAPVVAVSDLPLPAAWDRVDEAPRRVRTTQTLPDGTVLELTQWRTGEAQSPAEQRPVDAIDASLPLAQRVVRQGLGDDGRNFVHVELWSGQAVLAITAPLPLDSLLPLVARLEALR